MIFHPSDPPILFFDGVCGLCNGLVNVLLRADRNGVLRFAALQGETARQRLEPAFIARLDTLVLLDGHGQTVRSEAVLRALGHLGGAWRASALLRAVPRPIRDRLYGALAARRYRWFGRRDTCRVPTPAERGRFLP